MNRLLTALLAGGALMASGAVLAADQATQNPGTQTQSQPNAAKGTSGDTNAKSPANEHRPGVESKNENPDAPRDPKSVYSTELKKCDSLQGTEKQKCVAAAKKNLEAGFTTMRDLDSEGAGFADVALRDAINKGVVPGPRLFVATYALTITGGHMNLSGVNPDINVPDPATLTDSRDAMIAEIRREVKYGADWIKLYATGTLRHVNRDTLEPLSQVSLDDVKAVVGEAARWRKDVAAHAYGGVGARNAVEGGVRSIEHGWILDEDTLRLMVQKGTFWCPTLSVFRPEAGIGQPDEFSRRVVESHKRTFQAGMKAGVKIVFGTDVGGFPHGTNNREFTYMVEYGMTPLEAIRSATTRAAELLRMEKEIGSIAPGHYADIIAVQGDPLQNIEAIKNVRFVMKGGEVYVKPAAATRSGTSSQYD